MSLIQVSDLTFSYEGSYENIFENVSFQLDTDWRLGFTGRNGRGKTTFLRLLMGRYPYQGRISAPVQFSYFPYPVGDPGAMGIQIVEDICPEYEYWQLSRELSLLGLADEILYRPYNTLSNGEQTKLLLAMLFLRENNFLLIDEPTNHLDIRGRELVSKYLRSKGGFILVSHDRAFLDGCVDHILSINKADIQVMKGNFSTWYSEKQRQDAFEQAENTKLKKEIRRLEETAKEKAVWSDTAERRKLRHNPMEVDNVKGWRPLQGAKAKKTMARSKAIEKRQQSAIEEKSKLLKNIERNDSLKIFQADYHTDLLGELKDVSICYGQTPVCENISFQIRRGDRIALSGPNGCGKSSLLKLILGQPIPYSGQLKIGKGVTVSYVAQDTADLKGTLEDLTREEGIDMSLMLAMLSKLDVPKAQFEKDLRLLSMGQKKKVLLARSLCQKAHLHIWDEPMNYIDVISRIQLEELLLQYAPTILFVEHDKAFCRNVATKTVVF